MPDFHPNVAELMTERTWAITPEALSSLDAMLASSPNGKDTAPRAVASASHGDGPLLYTVRDGVAVISISGIIYRYGEPEWGLTGHDTIKAAVMLAMRDGGVSALLLSFCSPGGVASGVPELASWLASQTAKPVYAYADGLCASAAYYLASATPAQLEALSALSKPKAPAGTQAQQAILAHLVSATPAALNTGTELKGNDMAAAIDRIASL